MKPVNLTGLFASHLEWLKTIRASGSVNLHRNPMSEYAADRLVSAGVLRWADRKGECFDRVALTPRGREILGEAQS